MRNLKKANLADPKLQKLAIYNDGELALGRSDLHDLSSQYPFPVQTEIYLIVLIDEGKASVYLNGNACITQKNDLFICPPDNIIAHGMTSLDFRSRSMLVTAAYVQRILPVPDAWNLRVLSNETPVRTLQPQEATLFRQYHDLLCSKVRQDPPAPKKIIDTLMLAFVYDMQYCLSQTVNKTKHSYTSGETLFRRFVGLLDSTYPKPRSVAYYAGQLNVTPKYLSAVCKHNCGQRPSELIDRYVTKDIDYLMKHTQYSIKEIACELDFSNLSFFGKYVKKHFGMSPKSYREHIAAHIAEKGTPL